MASFFLRPGDPFPNVSAGDTVNLQPGTHAPFAIHGIPNVTVAGPIDGGAVVRGGTPYGHGDEREAPSSIRCFDGCDNLQLRSLELTCSPGHGLRVSCARNILIEDLKSHGHGLECVLAGHCPMGVYRRLECCGTSGDDHKHGLYVSGKSSGTLIELSRFWGVSGSAIQLNAASLGRDPRTDLMRNVTVKNCILEDSGGDGTPLLSLMGVTDSLFDSLALKRARAGLITMFSDGRGPEWACYRNTFNNIAVEGSPGFGIHSLEGSGQGSVEDGRGPNVLSCWTGWLPRGALPCPPVTRVCGRCGGTGKVLAPAA